MSQSPTKPRALATPRQWLSSVGYPELSEAVDEALLLTALKHPEAGLLAERWVSLPKRVRAHLHGQIRAALRRRMGCL
jgi:hypothetical protein